MRQVKSLVFLSLLSVFSLSLMSAARFSKAYTYQAEKQFMLEPPQWQTQNAVFPLKPKAQEAKPMSLSKDLQGQSTYLAAFCCAVLGLSLVLKYRGSKSNAPNL